MSKEIKAEKEVHWTFFSNHGHIYFLLAKNEDITLRDIAFRVGITERSALAIVQDLEKAGFIKKEKIGRSNHYQIIPNKTLRHTLESNVRLEDLIQIMSKVDS